MADKVKVSIYATEKLRYFKEIEISAEAAAEYDAAVEREEREEWFVEWGAPYLGHNAGDIYDTDGLDGVEMTRLPAKSV